MSKNKELINYIKLFNLKVENIEDKKPIFIKKEIPLLWEDNILPTTIFVRNKQLNLIEDYNQLKISPRKMVNFISKINLEIIQNLTTEDLIKIDLKNDILRINLLLNFNKGLRNWLLNFKKKYLLKMIYYTGINKNYNLMNLLIRNTQTKTLSEKYVKKLAIYKKMLNEQENGIYPTEWLVRDCADSNLNTDSELASKRFCLLVEKLKDMKKLQYNCDFKEKYRQLILGNIWNNLNQEVNEEKKVYTGIYMLIE